MLLKAGIGVEERARHDLGMVGEGEVFYMLLENSAVKTWVIVPAAGGGRRFGGPVPKQYLDLAGKPVMSTLWSAC